MKQRVVQGLCILLCGILLLSLYGCQQAPGPIEPAKDMDIYTYLLLHYGGILVVGVSKSDNPKEGNTLWLDFNFAPEGYQAGEPLDYLWDNPTIPERETKIFYDPCRKGEIAYRSAFCVIDNARGKEALVFVFPPRKVLVGPYEDSPAYGETPSDTLGTEPLSIQDPQWNYNYPLWIFDISLEDIPDDYKLYYAGFILTAEDLLTGTWEPPRVGNLGQSGVKQTK